MEARLTPEETEAIKALSPTELLKLHKDTTNATIGLSERIIKCYELLMEGGEDFIAIVNLPVIMAGIKKLKDESARLSVISRAAYQEGVRRASELT